MPVLKPKRDSYGNIIDYEFNPTHAMRYAARKRAQPKFSNIPEKEFCRRAGICENLIRRWRERYDKDDKRYFSEWWEEQLEINCDNEIFKNVLESIGREKAKDGDFQYWKEYARTYNIVSPDRIDIRQQIIPIDLKAATMSEDEFRKARERLMAEIYGLGYAGGPEVDSDSTEGQASTENGTRDVQDESMEIPHNLVQNSG